MKLGAGCRLNHRKGAVGVVVIAIVRGVGVGGGEGGGGGLGGGQGEGNKNGQADLGTGFMLRLLLWDKSGLVHYRHQ